MAGTLIGIRFGVNASQSFNFSSQQIDGSHTATYVVQSDDESDRENTILLTPGLPVIGSDSPILAGGKCVSIDCNEIGPKAWEVECEFETTSGTNTEPTESDPWDLLPNYHWETEVQEEPVTHDALNPTLAIRNSAGEPFPPILAPRPFPVLVISRTELTFDPDTILNYVSFVNSQEFWGAAAGEALMSHIEARQKQYKGQRVWEVTYRIKFNRSESGWALRLLDQGTYYWTGTVGSSTKKPFGDGFFQQIVGNLDGSGGENTTTTPEFVTWTRFDQVDFNTLDLGPWV